MDFETAIRQFQIELTRAYIAYAAASLICFILTMWCLYLVIRAAVRDGIQDSGLVNTWARHVAAQSRQHADTLPPDFTTR